MTEPKIALSLTEDECLIVIRALDMLGGTAESIAPYARTLYLTVCRDYESYKNATKREK
jgi:hypothetical protein